MNLADFGTEARPLRASSLPRLIACPWSVVMEVYEEGPRDSGPAADTGSAVHFAAAMWHGPAKKETAVAIEVMRRCLSRFPLANLTAAADQFQRYADDKRNQEAEVVLCEKEVTLRLKAETEIVIVGTLDQVRRDRHGRLAVYDIKTGSPEGWDMLHEHALQLAAYQIGASEKLGEEVHEAYIIRTKDYLKKRVGPVFWEAGWSGLAAARLLLQSVVETVQRVRLGHVWAGPGVQCKWCKAGGVAGCLPKLKELKCLVNLGLPSVVSSRPSSPAST